jgi:tetratricopeptide (TPR) repeat protein
VLERRGDLAAARRHYRDAVAANPRDRAATLRGAEIDLAVGRPAEAERSFGRLADAPGFEAAARFGLGRVLERRGDLAGAIAHFRRALELQPGASRARYALAQVYRRSGRAEEARRQIAAMGAAGSERPVAFPDPLIGSLAEAARGGAFHKFQGDQAVLAGRLADAAAAYRRAVEAEPGSFFYRKSLGLTLYRLGRAEEAAQELEAALDLEPDLPAPQVAGERARLHYALGGIAANQPGGGRRDLALGHFREAARLDPDYADAHLQIGNLLGAVGRLEEALAAFDRAVAADPDYPEARLQRATTLMDLGRFADAILDLERRLELVPGDERARGLLATARERTARRP